MIPMLIITGSMSLLLVAVIIHHEKIKTKELDKKYYQKKMQEIVQTLRVREVGPNMAVIQADKLMDHALKELGVPGKTMADRLRNYRQNLKDENRTWVVHKERNRLVHEPDATINIKRAKNAVKVIENELAKMGAL